MKRQYSLYFISSVCIFLLFMSATSAYAWGPLGHRTICDITWRYSSPKVKKEIAAAVKRMGYKTFADSCVWADEIKGQSAYDGLKPLHYMNVAKSADTVSTAACLTQQRVSCVLTAIQHYQQRWRDTSLSVQQRDQALLLLGHFIGDIHQPLHVSYASDYGGTRRQVIFEGKILSLHRLWDTELLYCQPLKGKRPSWRRLGRYLFEHKGASKRLEPRLQRLSIVGWADESLAITQQIYQALPHKKRSQEYCQRFYSIALERLHLAGWRLATLLAQTLVP